MVLVDAGVDSVCRGDEEGVGTFGEDLMSILAVRRLQGVSRHVMCVGLGTEAGISEFDFLQNWNELAKVWFWAWLFFCLPPVVVAQLGGFEGSVAWHKEMPSVKEVEESLLFVCCSLFSFDAKETQYLAALAACHPTNTTINSRSESCCFKFCCFPTFFVLLAEPQYWRHN